MQYLPGTVRQDTLFKETWQFVSVSVIGTHWLIEESNLHLSNVLVKHANLLIPECLLQYKSVEPTLVHLNVLKSYKQDSLPYNN